MESREKNMVSEINFGVNVNGLLCEINYQSLPSSFIFDRSADSIAACLLLLFFFPWRPDVLPPTYLPNYCLDLMLSCGCTRPLAAVVLWAMNKLSLSLSLSSYSLSCGGCFASCRVVYWVNWQHLVDVPSHQLTNSVDDFFPSFLFLSSSFSLWPPRPPDW